MQYNKRFSFATALFITICFVCGVSLSAHADGLISGKVIANDNQPIPGIFVDASDPCGGNWYGSGKSDEQGEYEISLPAGTYYLSTEASDYVGQWWKQTIQCNEAQAVVVSDGQTISGIDFQLQGIGSISGKISTSDDQPITGVKVNVFDQCDGMLHGSNTTDGSGAYLIEGLPEGDYYVSTYSEKYPGKWWDNGDGASECGHAVQISVSRGENTCDIDFRLGAGEVSGRIETSSGQPLANIRVEATDAPCGGNWYGEALSDASGNYLIPALVSGSYYIHAYDESNIHSDKWWDNASDCNESSAVSVSEGQTLSGINFLLDESAWISGQITDKRNGQPIPNISVRISALCGENESAHAFTDDSGHYSIPMFSPGGYYVFVSDENGAYQNEWWDKADGTDSCKNAAEISIAKAQKVSADFQLEVRKIPGDISGKVMNSLGQPIEGISVGVWGLCNESWYGGNSTDADGNYTVPELPQGEDYYVFAFDPSGKYVSKWWHHENGTMDCENAQWIRVATGQTTSDIDFQLDEGGEIAGQIFSGMGNLIEGIQVDVWDSCEGTWYGSDLTNESGNYSISGLPPGTYHIFISDEEGAYPAVWWNNGPGVADCSEAAPLTVTANQTIQMNITLEQKGSVSGTVVASDSGQPVRDVCVNAWGLCGEKWYGEAKSDGSDFRKDNCQR